MRYKVSDKNCKVLFASDDFVAARDWARVYVEGGFMREGEQLGLMDMTGSTGYNGLVLVWGEDGEKEG